MDLSIETPDDAFTTFTRPKKVDTLSAPSASCQTEDIIDSSKLSFNNDENWLLECPDNSETDLHRWLFEDENEFQPSQNQKIFDSRTFTRPKKRLVRPSIEKYNEELYGTDLKESTDSGIQINGESPSQPVQFDLGQTASSVYFENILANAPMMDSFQNMSPPSLVNSMCSSTFTNLMENSFIKNDPVLREIRDTDFTSSILQHEAEPMFHSISESYSSLNSDVPENFLKKVSFTDKNSVEDTVILNTTFTEDETVINGEFQDAKTTICEDLNSTYPCTNFNSTFQRRKNRSLNSTMTIEPNKIQKDKSIENVKRLLDRRPSPSLDLNRLSYIADKNDQMNTTFTNEKRNSFGSTDSGENLDYMSLSSSSSRSSKVRSIDGINMLVEEPRLLSRKSLIQIQSTPRNKKDADFWPKVDFSPISDRNSDPEMSSNEQNSITQNPIRKLKSVGNINHHKNTTFKSINTIGQENSTAIRGSHPNLKLTEPRTLKRPTNLNSMGHTLKGSYTSLRPTNRNLPVAPPPLDATVVKKTKNPVAQIPPVQREVPKSQDAQFVKPQPPKSGLPRPLTGIPRPVSRIPGPKALRPTAKSAGYQGRH